jgi:hypothetical protein
MAYNFQQGKFTRLTHLQQPDLSGFADLGYPFKWVFKL